MLSLTLPVALLGSGPEVHSSMLPSASETWFTVSDPEVYVSGQQTGFLATFPGSQASCRLEVTDTGLEWKFVPGPTIFTDYSTAYAASYPAEGITLRTAAYPCQPPCSESGACPCHTGSSSPSNS